MRPARWFRPPPILAVFLGIMCALGGALVWLCWQLLEQDRQLESQRIQERLEQAADRMAGTLATGLQEFDRWLPLALDGRTESPPEGVTLLLRTEHDVAVQPPGRLLYLPPTARSGNTDTSLDAVFAEGERREFQDSDPAGAAEYFRSVSTSPQAEARAGALLRQGRNLRKLGRYREALGVYEQLQLVKNAAIEGIPAELVGMDARCLVLETMGRRDDLRKEALLMDSGLRSGRWVLPGPAWDFHRQEVRRWVVTGALTEPEQQALALSRAAEWVCQLGLRPPEPKGRRILELEDRPVLISWTAGADRVAAVLVGPDALAVLWKQTRLEKGVRAALQDADGQMVVGSLAKDARRAVRSPAVAGWPATLLVTPSDPVADVANSAIRRRFLLAGSAVLGLVLIAGSFFILHSMARERAVARLQSEFVAAVSHEFRTPLTSLRQMTEMLARDRIPGEAQRMQSYDIMFHATERLQRLVESLLDFGRMEASAFRYQFAGVDLAALVERVVEEFRAQAAQGYQINLSQAGDLPPVRADRDSLGVAIWNLLDNAVKYSPQSPAVCVETGREGNSVTIAVRDEGLGIDPGEQGPIFERFVRGAAAHRSNIKGTGIGLSMARHIVRAHGGEIRLNSEPGRGSTFTIVLPAERQT